MGRVMVLIMLAAVVAVEAHGAAPVTPPPAPAGVLPVVLELANGTVYRSVMLRKRTAGGVSIIHAEGVARIRWEDLPAQAAAALGGFDAAAAAEFRKEELRKQELWNARARKQAKARARKARKKARMLELAKVAEYLGGDFHDEVKDGEGILVNNRAWRMVLIIGHPQEGRLGEGDRIFCMAARDGTAVVDGHRYRRFFYTGKAADRGRGGGRSHRPQEHGRSIGGKSSIPGW